MEEKMSYKGWAYHHVLAALFAFGCLVAGPVIGGARAGDTIVAATAAPAMIGKNALLQAIYRDDPGSALGLASEIERQITAFSDGHGDSGAAPRLRFRGPRSNRPVGDEEEILKDNRKDYQANPALKRLYQLSPLASLRMLKRLREAAGKLKQ